MLRVPMLYKSKSIKALHMITRIYKREDVAEAGTKANFTFWHLIRLRAGGLYPSPLIPMGVPQAQIGRKTNLDQTLRIFFPWFGQSASTRLHWTPMEYYNLYFN